MKCIEVIINVDLKNKKEDARNGIRNVFSIDVHNPVDVAADETLSEPDRDDDGGAVVCAVTEMDGIGDAGEVADVLELI